MTFNIDDTILFNYIPLYTFNKILEKCKPDKKQIIV